MDPAVLIRSVRHRAGLSQADLAERAGTSQPVISAYERGHRDPTFSTLRRLIEAGGGRLELRAATPQPALPPAVGDAEHAARLLDVLSLADAIPSRPRNPILVAPRLVTR